jgi:hypothetical protein
MDNPSFDKLLQIVSAALEEVIPAATRAIMKGQHMRQAEVELAILS